MHIGSGWERVGEGGRGRVGGRSPKNPETIEGGRVAGKLLQLKRTSGGPGSLERWRLICIPEVAGVARHPAGPIGPQENGHRFELCIFQHETTFD